MERYPSIENIFRRSSDGKTVERGNFRNDVVGELANARWIFTEKVDGTNVRVILFPTGKIEFRGRSDKAELPRDLVLNLAGMFYEPSYTTTFARSRPNAKWKEQFAWWFDTPQAERPTITLYGEGYGPGIQNGGDYGHSKSFILFDVKVGHQFLSWQSVTEVAEGMGIKHVPVVGAGPLHKAVQMVTDGWDSKLLGRPRCEGIVARLLYELRDGRGQRLLVKIKDRDLFVDNGQLELSEG